MLLNQIPAYLQKIFIDFDRAERTGKQSLHRFWIEAEPVYMASKYENERNHIALSQMKMVIKKHRMTHNIIGMTIDDESEPNEGWPIYVVQSEFKEKGPAIVFIQGDPNKLFFVMEDGTQTAEYELDRWGKEINRLFALNRDYRGKVYTNLDKDYIAYKITRLVTQRYGHPDRFTPEYRFACEFSIHYDEIAQYFPIFGRLRELSKLALLIQKAEALRFYWMGQLGTNTTLIGCNSIARDRPIPEDTCLWVPANVRRENIWGGFRTVYGGVHIKQRTIERAGGTPEAQALVAQVFSEKQQRQINVSYLISARVFYNRLTRTNPRVTPHYYFRLLQIYNDYCHAQAAARDGREDGGGFANSVGAGLFARRGRADAARANTSGTARRQAAKSADAAGGGDGNGSGSSGDEGGSHPGVGGLFGSIRPGDHKYHPVPKILQAFSEFQAVKRKTPVQGGGGLRKRWKHRSGEILEWDSRHGALEKFDKHGHHLGEYDPASGRQLKPADKARSIKKFL